MGDERADGDAASLPRLLLGLYGRLREIEESASHSGMAGVESSAVDFADVSGMCETGVGDDGVETAEAIRNLIDQVSASAGIGKINKCRFDFRACCARCQGNSLQAFGRFAAV